MYVTVGSVPVSPPFVGLDASVYVSASPSASEAVTVIATDVLSPVVTLCAFATGVLFGGGTALKFATRLISPAVMPDRAFPVRLARDCAMDTPAAPVHLCAPKCIRIAWPLAGTDTL